MRQVLLAILLMALPCCGAFGQSSGLPDFTAVHVVAGKADKPFNLSDGSTPASTSYVQSAIASTTGATGTTQSYIINKVTTAASAGWNKICYVGNLSCNGGVGSNAPATTPTMSFGLSSPTQGSTTPGQVAHFQVQSSIPSASTDVLWPNNAGNADAALFFTRDAWIKVVTAASGTYHIEFDTYQFDHTDSQDAMFGGQCNGSTHVFQYANQSSSWQNTAVNCSALYDGNWHHIQQTFHRDAASSTACSGVPCQHWDTITLDGVQTTLNVTMPVTTTTWSGSGDQWQLDVDPSSASSGSPAVYDLYVDSDTYTASTTVASSGTSSSTVNEVIGNLGEYDFDTSSPLSGLTSTGTPSVDNTLTFTTPGALMFNGDAEYVTGTLASSASTVYARTKIYVTSSNAGSTQFMAGYNGASQLWNLFFTATTGAITFNNNALNTQTTCGSALSTGTWHLVEMQWVQSGTAGSYNVSIDKTQVCSVTSVNTGTKPALTVKFGELSSPTTPWVFSMDNVGFSSTGPLGDVTVTATPSAPLYDLNGAAAAAQQASLQISKNLGDITNPAAALAALLGLPGQGAYSVVCGTQSCVPVVPGIAGRNVTTTSDPVVANDQGGTITYNSSAAVSASLPDPSLLNFNMAFAVLDLGSGSVTFTPTAGTINGSSTLVLSQNESCAISSPDRVNYIARCGFSTQSGGSSSYSQGGTGATTRTVTAKLQETVSVTDFGADPTGTADSTTAFNNAIAALPNGGVLNIPCGTFKINPVSSLSPVSGTVVQGGGPYCTTVQYSGATSTPIWLANSYVNGTGGSGQFLTFRNFTMSGNSVAGSVCFSIGTPSNATAKVQNVKLDNMRVTACGTGLVVNDNWDMNILNSDIAYNLGDGILISDPDAVTGMYLFGTRIHNNGGHGINNTGAGTLTQFEMYGGEVTYSGGTEVVLGNCRDCDLYGVWFEEAAAGSAQNAVDVTSGIEVRIDNMHSNFATNAVYASSAVSYITVSNSSVTNAQANFVNVPSGSTHIDFGLNNRANVNSSFGTATAQHSVDCPNATSASLTTAAGLMVNACSGNNIFDLYANGAHESYMSNTGALYLKQIYSLSGSGLGGFTLGTSSAPNTITRNFADAYPVLVLNQANASGTGDLLQLQNQGVVEGGYNPQGVPFTHVGTSIASAATIAPTVPAFHITGTVSVSTITPPTNCTSSTDTGCRLEIIPDAATPFATGGNIAVAFTAVVGVPIELIYDQALAQWYPSIGVGSTGGSGSGIANTTITVGTSAVAANSCTTTSTVTMTGLTTSMALVFTPSADVSSTTGWSPGTGGQLYFTVWPSAANTASYKVCNATSASITPGASTVWNVAAINSNTIANTTFTVGTTAVAANTCTSATTVTMTGLTTSMTLKATPATDISSTTGWSPATGGQLYFTIWPSAANTASVKTCNPTSSSITPGASTTWNLSAK